MLMMLAILYCDGDRFTDHAFLNETHALMEFKITLIPYKCDLNWIETTLNKIHENLRLEERPKHSDNCEYGKFIHEISETSKKLKIKTLFSYQALPILPDQIHCLLGLV